LSLIFFGKCEQVFKRIDYFFSFVPLGYNYRQTAMNESADQYGPTYNGRKVNSIVSIGVLRLE